MVSEVHEVYKSEFANGYVLDDKEIVRLILKMWEDHRREVFNKTTDVVELKQVEDCGRVLKRFLATADCRIVRILFIFGLNFGTDLAQNQIEEWKQANLQNKKGMGVGGFLGDKN
ncbi:MAG: hypothetical protein FWD52_04650 [Candidatus Bathyarchaeota archaeon]|nr:hypothetical protein [Candidatus Termiticorpusculum sp.]